MNVVLYSLPKWAKGKHPLLPKDMQDWAADDPRWDDLSVVTVWDRYVTAIVKRYADRGFVWEVVNEPEFDHWDHNIYVKFFSRTRKLVKAVNPKQKVVHGSVNGVPDRISREFLARGGAELCDIFCFHNYTLGEYLDGPGIRTMKGAFRAAGRKDGGPEIWMNEGWAHFPSSEDYRAATRVADRSPAWVADTAVRSVADTFAAGMEKCIVFNMGYPDHGSSWWDWGGDGTSWYDNLDQPTVAVGAFNVLADQLGKCRPVATVRPAGAVLHVFHDDRHDRGVVVGWATDKPRAVVLPATLTVIDVMGNPLPMVVEKGQTTVSLAAVGRPVYAFAKDGMSGDRLAKALAPLGPKAPTLADTAFSPSGLWYNDGQFANPFKVEDKPMWELGRVWPPEPDKAASYSPFADWDAGSSKWLDAKTAFGGNPAGVVRPDGQVTITAVGPRKGGDRRASTLSFIAPADGSYTVVGRVVTHRWEGNGDLVLDALRIDPVVAKVDKLDGWALKDRKAHPFTIEAVELKAGQRLVFRFTVEAHNTQSSCTFEELTVSRK